MRALPALLSLLLAGAGPLQHHFTINNERFQQAEILDARAIFDGSGAPAILVTLTAAAAPRLAAISAANVGKPVAIAIGSTVIARPIAREAIANGAFEISGVENIEQAKRMARQISGKDPLPESLDE